MIIKLVGLVLLITGSLLVLGYVMRRDENLDKDLGPNLAGILKFIKMPIRIRRSRRSSKETS